MVLKKQDPEIIYNFWEDYITVDDYGKIVQMKKIRVCFDLTLNKKLEGEIEIL